MHRTITIHDRNEDIGYSRINVRVDIDGLVSTIGTNDATVAQDVLKRALAGEYDRCMEECEGPAIYPVRCDCGWFGMREDCLKGCCPNCGGKVARDIEAEAETTAIEMAGDNFNGGGL